MCVCVCCGAAQLTRNIAPSHYLVALSHYLLKLREAMCANSKFLMRWVKRPMVVKFAEWKDVAATEKGHRAKIRKMLYRIEVG